MSRSPHRQACARSCGTAGVLPNTQRSWPFKQKRWEGGREGGRGNGYLPSSVVHHLKVLPQRPKNLRLAQSSLTAVLHNVVCVPHTRNVMLPRVESDNGPLGPSDFLGNQLKVLPVLLRSQGEVVVVLGREDLVGPRDATMARVA